MGTKFNSILTSVFLYTLVPNVYSSIGSVDFSKVAAGDDNFVDKTLFIKEFLEDGPQEPVVKIITAPTKFGKSLNLDMLKRFLSIPVDSGGKRIAPNTTENYQLFCDTKLKICENETFVTEHFGRYPIVHVNFHNLATVNNYQSFLDQLRLTIRNTFVEHDYLLYNESLFTRDKDLFSTHCSMSGVVEPEVMVTSFSWLLDLLAAHFQSRVILLVDQYDGLATNALFGELNHAKQIVKYLHNLSRHLFDSGKIHKALLTGVLRVKELGLLPDKDSRHSSRYYRWLADHRYSEYFGFTMDEVSEIFRKHIHEAKRRRRIKRHARLFYSGYVVQYRSSKLFNPWSMVHFIQSKCTPGNYWCRSSRLDELFMMIAAHQVSFTLIRRLLVHGKRIRANIYKPFDLKNIVDKDKLRKNNRLLVLLFDSGFLVPGVQRQNAKPLVPLKFPNIEIHMEFSRLIMRLYVRKYNCSMQSIKILHSAVDSLKYNRNNTKVYHKFYSTMDSLIRGSSYYPKTRFQLHVIIQVMLSSSFPCGRRVTSSVPPVKPDMDKVPVGLKEHVKCILDKQNRINKTEKSFYRKKSDIVLRNAEKMGVIIEFGFKGNKEKRSLRELALYTLSHIYVSYDSTMSRRKAIKFEGSCIRPKGKIYIGLAFHMATRNMCIAFYSPMYDKTGPIVLGHP